MKKLALFALVLFVGNTAFAQGSKIPGFRNLVWGIHKDSVKTDGQLMKFKKDRDVAEPNAYKLDDERLKVGAAKLTKINYYFNDDDRFKKVVLKGDTQYYADMHFIVTSRFGKPQETMKKEALNMLVWRDGDVTLRLNKYANQKEFTFMIESNWDVSEGFVKNLKVKDFPVKNNEVIGFRHMKWLVHKDSILLSGEKQNFTLEDDADQPNTYFLSKDLNVIGTARLSNINYIFNDDDRLYKVVIKGDANNYDDMLSILTAKFGQSDGSSNFSADITMNTWKIGSTNIKLTMTDEAKGFTLIMETSKAITERKKQNLDAWDKDF
ncbi:MAG: hypothetical protein KDC92_09930 [Bacteroidetes bacterium]|nr:hypothetical protein [Bacteroidota bacterium]